MRALSGLASRVKRLELQHHALVGAGCATCRDDEARARYYWDELPADTPTEATCQCGRTYPLNNTVIAWRTRDEN